MIDKFANGMKKTRDEHLVSPDGDRYHSREWTNGKHTIEVNVDQEGKRPYHVRVDKKHTAANLDEGGVMSFLFSLFGRH